MTTGRPADDEPPFLAACRGRPTSLTPVWFMRQAGRSLPEYHEVRGTGSILDVIADPDRATEITLQPVRRHGVDAAILYSDIVVPVAAIGFGVEIDPGTGPVVARPFRSADDLDRLRPLQPAEDTWYVLETVRRLRKESPVPVIGFAGAPFTVASYLVEGGPSRTHRHTKILMHEDPDLFHRLLDRLADLAIASLTSQVESGVAAVQVFDSWVGCLHVDDYRSHVLPASRRVFDAVRDLGVPSVHFGVDTGELLGAMADAGPDVVGVDWRVRLDDARDRIGTELAVQGNLDPTLCLAGWDTVAAGVDRVLGQNGGRPGHIFNLGHGVLPETPPETLTRIVAHVHAAGPTRS